MLKVLYILMDMRYKGPPFTLEWHGFKEKLHIDRRIL